MTTEITSQLPPCPLPDCGGGEHHSHDIDIYTFNEPCLVPFGYRCYGPHRPGPSEPIDLPDITDEMVESARSRSMYDTFGSLHSFAVGIRVALLASIPRWQPIEHDQIKAGMRIRATVQCDDRTTSHVGVAHHRVGADWITEKGWGLTGWSRPTIYEVDPSTIPDDPDAELIEKIGKAIRDSDEPDEMYRKLARAALNAVRESEVGA